MSERHVTCPPEYGGRYCNLDRSVCNNRGYPGKDALDATDPQCHSCDGNFRSGGKCADSDCKPGWYGRNCDVASTACGTIDGVVGSALPGPNAKPDDPDCGCSGISAPPDSASKIVQLVRRDTNNEVREHNNRMNRSYCGCPSGYRLEVGESGPYCKMVTPCQNAISGNVEDKNCVCKSDFTKASADGECLYQANVPVLNVQSLSPDNAMDCAFYRANKNIKQVQDALGGYCEGTRRIPCHGFGQGNKNNARAVCHARGQHVRTYPHSSCSWGQDRMDCTGPIDPCVNQGRCSTAQ